jgi:LysR family transcriptional activator of nhaA
MNAVKGRGTNEHPARLIVGIVDVVAKPLATEFLKSALKPDQPTRLSCREDKLPFLLADLAVHQLDLIIADTPASPSGKVQIYNHLLGESGVTLFATAKLAAQYRRGFPKSLHGAPMLLPTTEAMLRRLMDPWLAHRELSPNIVGEFDDSMTLKTFGQDGYGIFPGATAVEKEICRQYRVQVVGQLDSLKQHFYAITVERRLKHPAVLAIVHAARRDLHN